jgi:hypothetical protein
MPLSAAQIIQDALAIAKCPGFTQQGGRALNFVLDDLVQHRNLKVNLVSVPLAITAGSIGPYNLEADYLRTYDLVYYVNGEPHFINPTSMRNFDADNYLFVGTGYPYEFATDLSAQASQGLGLMYVFPPSNAPITATHRYFLARPQIATPESSAVVPWFADQDYLVQATAMRMMRITDDSRYEGFVQNCENMLRLHLVTEGDEQQVVKEVKLDPRRFRSTSGARPTKLDPW